MDDILYTNRQVASMFDVAIETVRSWANEFERHTSPRANPGKNKSRAFTQSDIEVFALVAEMKSQGLNFSDIHVALDNGQRGTIPALIPTEKELSSTENERALSMQNRELVQTLEDTHSQLQLIREEKIRLESELKTTKANSESNLAKADKKIEDLQQERASLNQQIGKLQGKLEAIEGKD